MLARESPELDPFHASAAGYNDFNRVAPAVDFAAKVDATLAAGVGFDDIAVDESALQQLADVVRDARRHGAIIYAFYYPHYAPLGQAFIATGAMRRYQERVGSLFQPGDVIWDMNTSAFARIHSDIRNYTDGHLSDRGAALVAGEIDARMRGKRATSR